MAAATGTTPPGRTGPDTRATRIAALEAVAAAAWPATEQQPLGGWLLRAAHGWTGRANSALPLGDPGMPLPAALDRVRSWYAARHLPARVNVPLPLAAALDTELDRLGWRPSPPVLVQTAPLPTRADPPAPVRITPSPDRDWLDIIAGQPRGLPSVAHGILTGGPLVGFAGIRLPDGRLGGIARGVVDGDWLGLFLIEVIPPARRQGLARHLIAGLSAWAAGHGASRAYLQVERHNTPAVALYRTCGFTTHHSYVGRTAP